MSSARGARLLPVADLQRNGLCIAIVWYYWVPALGLLIPMPLFDEYARFIMVALC